MQQKLDLQLKGLYTAPNNLSSVPQGALEIADNVVIDKVNIVESRRGQTQYGNSLSIGSDQVNKIFNYASSLISNYSDKLAYDSGNGNWITYSGSYTAPSSDYKIRSLEALRNFYFTTSKGIYKLDRINGTPRPAGVVEALSGTAKLVGSSGFLANDSAVAYRILWGYRDANSNLLLGTPSQRLVIANTSGTTSDVELNFIIPNSITTDYFYQIYRSNGTVTANDEPNDELQLVIQGVVNNTEIANKSFTVVDSTPYSLMRTTIYTAPSQEGISNANYAPPYAVDMDIFKGSAFYANVKQKQQVTTTIISVDTPSFGYYVSPSVSTTVSNILTGIADTTDIRIGMRVVGTNIPNNTYVKDILSSTSVEMTNSATAVGTVSIEFQDRITVDNIDYWAGSVEDIPSNTFHLVNSGTPGANINDSTLNLIHLINTSPSNTRIYAYYLSGVSDLPGQILFKERSIGGEEFFVTSTVSDSFSPKLPMDFSIVSNTVSNPTVVTSSLPHGLSNGDYVRIYNSDSVPSINGTHIVTVTSSTSFSIPVNVTTAGTTGNFIKSGDIVVSTNDAKQNRVYASKPSQVESVPLYTYFDIGSANFPIQRVVALRDGIFFFKKDGIFRLSGENFSSWTVSLVDNTTSLVVPESAVPFNNQVFCFTDQGICAVSDSGVQIMSVPIENILLELNSEQYPHFVSSSFAVAYESSRQYMFFTVTDKTDEFSTQGFIYNSLTKTWTRWVMDRTCGVVNTAINKLFMAQADTGQILIERKTFTNDDYADEEYPIYVSNVISDNQLEVLDTTLIKVGMTIKQSTRSDIVTAVDSVNNIITVKNDKYTYSVGSATVFTPIFNKVQWSPIDAENPGILKQYSEITLAFRNAAFQSIKARFTSNIIAVPETVEIVNNSTTLGWGNFQWGELEWGGALGGNAVLRTYIPRNMSRASWVSISLETEEAFTGFSLQGISLLFNPMSSRFK